ncbi:MAG: hypothetical protein HUU57_15095 [Bdellovibrio sp.]|nr:hypothetical protein [Bdellovibrio sp.]
MKAFIVSMMLVAGATVANAASYVESVGGDQEVEYLTWCQGNTVVGLTEKGDVYAVANCEEQALVCKTTKRYFSAKTLVTASCKAQ